ncbi:hypothetical protein O181_057378 [Austropuccinia psidii MF-1]|uniref:Ty3 transposon capsid-like protein domain-containing protein n=1 Tax=Austropuccinia psidii MF-1 TaxID=1389203 RepID=A0A9Q3EEW4_9BASI|nr:hypothetical protein [Austropuccinia psidii MF-1]
MAVQHSPPAKNTISQRNPAVLTATERVLLDLTPSVHQLSANLDRGPPMEGAAPSRRGVMKSRKSRSFSGLLGGYSGMSEGARERVGEVEDEEGEESVGEEDSGETEVEDALANAPEVPQGSNLAPTNQPLVSQSNSSPLKIMEQMSTMMGQLSQAEAPRDNSKAPAFKTPSMKAPYSFDGTKVHKLRGFIQSCQLIFHNDPANFLSDRKKVLYSTSFLTGRAGKWIEPYVSNIFNEDPSYLLNNWQLFEAQLFTLFGDHNEVRKAEQELDNSRMNESSHVSFYIAYFRILMSRIGDWEERAYIHVYRRGLASRPFNQLASYPGKSDTLQDLMDITLELDTRYHERQKEKGSHQERKPPVTGSIPSRPPQDSSSKRPHHRKNRKGKQFQASEDKPHSTLLNNNNKLIGSEKDRRIKEGLCTYFGGKNPIEKFFKRYQNKPGSSIGFPSKQGKA